MFAYDMYKKYISRRTKNQMHTVLKSFLIPIEDLQEQGYLIPGPEHKRELPFTTYSDLNRQQFVGVRWDNLDYYGTTTLPVQSLIGKVKVVQLDQLYVDASLHLKMTCEISFTVYDNDKYYDVPAASRWRYGAAYFVLAGVLGGMMYLVHVVGNVNL